jgi:SagB-type dehydrogenase family enzyme
MGIQQLLADPRPRKKPKPVPASGGYKTTAKFYLPRPEVKANKSFFKVLAARASRRSFAHMPDEKLAAFLWYSAKALTLSQGPHNIFCQHRFVPSAGGLHPIDLIVIDVHEQSASVYDPIAHALCKLDATEEKVATFLAYSQEVLNPGSGTIIWFAARPEKVSAKYTDELSLIWRDAGALIASMYLIAEALSLNCCALGNLGSLELQTLTDNPAVIGTGGCIIGAR